MHQGLTCLTELSPIACMLLHSVHTPYKHNTGKCDSNKRVNNGNERQQTGIQLLMTEKGKATTQNTF